MVCRAPVRRRTAVILAVKSLTVDAIDRAGDLRLRRMGVARCGGTGGVVARQ